jgi:hypothetical protein
MVDEESIVYLAATALVALLLILTSTDYGILGYVMVILTIFGMGIILAINYVDFLVFPAIMKAFHLRIIPANGIMLSEGNDAVVKVTNGVYYATGYLTGNVYGYVFTSQQPEQNETDLSGAVDRWERIAMNIDFPFKFNLITIPEDVQKYRDELDGQRGYLEFQISREMNATNPNTMSLEALQRRMQIIQQRMDRVSAGERPLNVVMYIESTAVGVSEKEALDAVSLQLNQLQTLFNALDLSIFRVTGREVHYLHDFDYRIPGEAELLKMFQTQK